MAKLIHLALILGVVGNAFAISCYDCDSSKDLACNIGFLSFTQKAVDCNEGSSLFGGLIPKSCIKITAKDSENNEFVARKCSVNVGFNACDVLAKTMEFMSSKNGAHDFNCYTCTTDKCNSAVSLGSTAILSVLAACFLFLF